MTDSKDRPADGPDGGPDDGPGAAKKPTGPKGSLWRETVVLLIGATLLAILVRAFLVQAFYIPSASMEPLFYANDRILVQKVSYWGSGQPQRGDVVVFADPGGWFPGRAAQSDSPLARALISVGLRSPSNRLVKRVIGVGGDRVVCCDDRRRITVNGEPLDESDYLPSTTSPSDISFKVTVPRGSLWVMGDNRGNSADSRSHRDTATGGFVDEDLVVGKVFLLVWPLNRERTIG